MLFANGHSHFLEMSGGDINATELVAALINQKENLIEGIRYALGNDRWFCIDLADYDTEGNLCSQ